MKVTFFSSKPYDKEFFDKVNQDFNFELDYFETHLGPHILNVIDHCDAVCAFVNDTLNAEVLESLSKKGVKYIALRCAGFNNVDLEVAKRLGMRVCRVPAYSPEAVAEHAMAMILTLNRKTHKAYNRVREQNFSLNGLMGFNLFQKTIGVIGTGNIGTGAKWVSCDNPACNNGSLLRRDVTDTILMKVPDKEETLIKSPGGYLSLPTEPLDLMYKSNDRLWNRIFFSQWGTVISKDSGKVVA